MQVAFLRRPANFFAARGARNISPAWRKRFENGIEAFHHRRFPANHLAIAALQSPDAAARAHVTVMNSLRGKLFRAANVINVVRISAINHHVVFFKLANQIMQCGIHHRRRYHEPNRARLLQLGDKIIQRRSARRALP